jgi:hypothetical protein
VAVHILSRARHARTGRIGLIVTPGGFGTPVYPHEVQLRVEGGGLVRDHRGVIERAPITSMRSCALLARVDLTAPFDAGHDTPPVGPDAIALEPRHLARLADFFAFAWSVLGEIAASDAEITLWPAHFDCAFVHDGRVNVGASPGDAFCEEPYLYIGPWGPERPGDPSFWNAPFGAFTQTDDREMALAFYRRGLELLG